MESTPTKIALIVEYDGTNYYGFQLQAKHPDQPTIQSELEKAIFRLTQEESRVLAASRTDTGVHAKGQVVSFKSKSVLSTKNFVTGLNHFLPEDIAVREAYRVPDSFNVRTQAVGREYRYYILNRKTRSPLRNRFSYLVTQELDIPAMDEASRTLIGEHDLASFTGNLGNRTKTVRFVSCSSVEQSNEMVLFNMTASSFLPHQIRNTVGALIQVGIGKMTVSGFYDMINAKKPGLAGPRVPSRGLFLMRVIYSGSFGEKN